MTDFISIYIFIVILVYVYLVTKMYYIGIDNIKNENTKDLNEISILIGIFFICVLMLPLVIFLIINKKK
jgi:mannose/fructose/N-acetylgalactosamine-specific phosphotransferase system component IID